MSTYGFNMTTFKKEKVFKCIFYEFSPLLRSSNILGREERSVEISGKPRPPTFSRDQPEILTRVDQVDELDLMQECDLISSVFKGSS